MVISANHASSCAEQINIEQCHVYSDPSYIYDLDNLWRFVDMFLESSPPLVWECGGFESMVAMFALPRVLF